MHGFKNRTGSTGSTNSTTNRCFIQFGSLKKPEIRKKWSKTGNRRFDHENREPEWLNRFWPGSTYSKTTLFLFFFPSPKTNFFHFQPSLLTPQSSRHFSLSHFASRSLTLTFSPSASHDLTSNFSWSHLRHLGLNLSLSRFLTSRSHFWRDLTSANHGLNLSPSHLSGSRSHRRLGLLLAIPPLLVILPSPHSCDLIATARPRSLSPTDPAKGHSAPIKLSPSLSLSHSHSQILVYWLFFFFPIFSLWFGVYWVVGLLVWIVWNFDFYSSVFVVLLDWNFDWNLTIFVVLLGCWSAGVICKLVCIHLYMLCNLFDIWFYCKIVICMV